jgi:septum formation protein
MINEDWATVVGTSASSSVPTAARLRLVLASGSSARLRVLRDAGFDPEVVVSGVSEEVEHLTTAEAVVALAERKAIAVARHIQGGLVLGCDSLLDLEGTALGKPKSEAEVFDVWHRLSGREAELFTGHCLIDTRSGRRVSRVVGTLVQFGTPTEAELGAYAASGEPLALAGAFSIEGLGAPFVDGIRGDPSNVLGLSLPLLRRMLAEVDVGIADLWRGTAGPTAQAVGEP